ncbi:serine acetyltransferase [Limosilactobacillus reuteri]|uniref:serine acetyltransferase n=1 Tax=Limosilactobacillus reuteri TaxID=1598 RepID=UPI000A1E9503|nr:hypothetical protein [Limosilactobacillus reuteri]
MEKKLDKKGKLLLSVFKFGKKHVNKTGIYHKVCFAFYKIMNFVIGIIIFGSELQPSQTISENIFLYHPYGIIINSASQISDGCVIRQQVTIGNKGIGNNDCPIIKENVEIGAGAKIIGAITIGKNSKIGANAVVTKSFPENSILVGVPAKNIAK